MASNDSPTYPSLIHHGLPAGFYDPDSDPRRLEIQALLARNYRAMIAAYSAFTLGWFVTLFSPWFRQGLAVMAASFGGLAVYGMVRNRGIRKLGFSEDHPYPSDWSAEFHDREPEAFKAYTTVWTFAFFAWALLRYFS